MHLTFTIVHQATSGNDCLHGLTLACPFSINAEPDADTPLHTCCARIQQEFSWLTYYAYSLLYKHLIPRYCGTSKNKQGSHEAQTYTVCLWYVSTWLHSVSYLNGILCILSKLELLASENEMQPSGLVLLSCVSNR